jgi:hypothetical protein
MAPESNMCFSQSCRSEPLGGPVACQERSGLLTYWNYSGGAERSKIMLYFLRGSAMLGAEVL